MVTTSVRIGRIAGIDVGVNWSWFVVFGLVAITLALAVFPEVNEGLSDAAYWTMGIVAALLFFASILLHELGHALQARRDDVEIEGITLWLLGGVARFKDLYASPGAEFRIAIAGPLVTVGIVVVLLALLGAMTFPEGVTGVLSWLAVINGFVLVFNLLPALPLDGGRILHAALWRRRGDLAWATRVGSAIGVGFGYALAGAGIALFIFTTAFGGLWIALLGWFMATAARAEEAQLAAREALEGLTVSDLMAHAPIAVSPDLTVSEFIDEVARPTRFTTYPVIDPFGRPLGLLTFRQVTSAPREGWDRDRVGERMIPREQVPVVSPGEDAAKAFREVAGGDVRRALVVDGERLVGLVSITDFMRAIDLPRPAAAGARRL